MQHRRTKWVWNLKPIYFSHSQMSNLVTGGWSSNRKSAMGQFGVRNDEHRKSAEPEVVHGSVPARRDTLEWLWSAPCESVQPVYKWPAASPEASVVSEAAAWRRCGPGSGRRLWPGCSGRAVVCQKSYGHLENFPRIYSRPTPTARGYGLWMGQRKQEKGVPPCLSVQFYH